jgi:hypothetical protein
LVCDVILELVRNWEKLTGFGFNIEHHCKVKWFNRISNLWGKRINEDSQQFDWKRGWQRTCHDRGEVIKIWDHWWFVWWRIQGMMMLTRKMPNEISPDFNPDLWSWWTNIFSFWDQKSMLCIVFALSNICSFSTSQMKCTSPWTHPNKVFINTVIIWNKDCMRCPCAQKLTTQKNRRVGYHQHTKKKKISQMDLSPLSRNKLDKFQSMNRSIDESFSVWIISVLGNLFRQRGFG